MHQRSWYSSLVLVLVVGIVSVGLGGVAPILRYTSVCDRPMEPQQLPMMQSSSQDLYWTFKQVATTNSATLEVKNISAATNISFVYAPADRTWRKTTAGALVNTGTNGQVLVSFTPSDLNTNSLAGEFDWVLSVVSTGNVTLAYAFGKLALEENVIITAGGLVTDDNVLDFSVFNSYTNVVDQGPYKPGFGIKFTTNTDQKAIIALNTTNSPVTNYYLAYGGGGSASNLYWKSGIAGGGDMNASTYDPAMGQKQVAFYEDSVQTNDPSYLNSVTNLVGGTNINVVRSGRIYTINSDTNPIVGSATNAADTMAIAKYAPQSQTNAIRIGATGEAYTASVTLDTDATNATRVMADAKYLGILRAQMTDNTVSSDYAMAIGSGAYANGSGAVALGLTTWAVGAGAFAHGNASRAQAADAEVGGNNAYADHSNSYVWADSVETHSSTSQEYTVYASKGVRLNPTVTVNGTNVMPTLFAKADGNHTHTVFTNDLTMSGSVVSNATFIMTNNTAQSDLIYGGSNAVQWIRGTNTYILLLGLP